MEENPQNKTDFDTVKNSPIIVLDTVSPPFQKIQNDKSPSDSEFRKRKNNIGIDKSNRIDSTKPKSETTTKTQNLKQKTTEQSPTQKSPKKQKIEVIDVDKFHSSSESKFSLRKLCQLGYLTILKKKIEAGEKANAACVFLAAKNRNYDVVRFLLEEKKTNFNVETFSFVFEPKILSLLMKHIDLVNPPEREESKRLLEKIKNVAALRIKEKNNLKAEEAEMQEICKRGSVREIREFLLSGKQVTEKDIRYIISEGKRDIFNVILEFKEIYVKSRKSFLEDDLKALNSSVLPKLIEMGWENEAHLLLKNGLEFSHKDINEESVKLMALLHQFPSNIRFPYTAAATWLSLQRGQSFLSCMESALATKQKIERFFKGCSDKRKEKDQEFVSCFEHCMELFLRLEK